MHRLKMCSVILLATAATLSLAEEPIREKTLVAWVSPAELTQRGGSALTLENGDDHFDAIVLGELAPGKWMPGSNFYDRTHKDQSAWPAETADAKTVVQIAIVYKGKEISIFRDGKPYAAYPIGQLQEFGSASFAVIGVRHVAAGGGWFSGAIHDARIYRGALSAEQISALKAGQLSDPKPLAWWNFSSGKAEDVMGAFPQTKLFGKAKVADGKLQLDGAGSYLVSGKGELATWKGAGAPAGVAVVGGDPVADARALREKLLADPHRPGYHFVIPEDYAMPFDPNGAIYWKGRYHLFYIFQDRRGHNWGHASSTDMFHWRHHPTGLTAGMFSGNCFINKDGVPTMCYHQVGQGNAMAVALDDELNEWKKLDSNPITPKTQPGDPHHNKYRSWDPYAWIEDGSYYAIFGGNKPGVAKAPKLEGEWTYVGDLMAGPVEGVSINEDVSCADFFKLGDKRMLLCISHKLGCRYYLGEWKNEQFHPTFHEKMSWVDNSYFAPESLLDDKGRRIMWAWLFDEPGFKMHRRNGWSGTMSLPRQLLLGEGSAGLRAGSLHMRPVDEIKDLRYDEQTTENVTLDADKEVRMEKIAGNSLELLIEIEPQGAKQCGVKICCSPDGAEQTLVYYDATDQKLKIDVTKASLSEGPKNIEAGPFALKDGESLSLRVFIDKSVVEAFANERQAAMRRIYPTRADSTGVALFAKGGAAKVRSVKGWKMAPSNSY
ncbi:MAG TPA: GH32 C-terminal domain-containing protein [Planctomycetota bacterium]|jgi:sucrose-6-phosphate hydrolase SacC (GH32 family)